VKPPKIKTIPDILTLSEVERLIGGTQKLRYRVFLLLTYSLGLRLDEALTLQVGDIDAQHKLVHTRRGKGHKDRLLPLPDLSGAALNCPCVVTCYAIYSCLDNSQIFSLLMLLYHALNFVLKLSSLSPCSSLFPGSPLREYAIPSLNHSGLCH